VCLGCCRCCGCGAVVGSAAALALMSDESRRVVCDGPPAGTRGGRFGLLSVIGDRLPAGAVILLDDADRDTEQHTLRRWMRDVPLAVALRQLPSGTLAELTRC